MDNSVINIIRDMNDEYIKLLYSPYYRHGRDLYDIYNLLKSHKYRRIIEKLKELVKRKKTSKKYNESVGAFQISKEGEDYHYKSDFDVTMYTCIVGGYDKIQEPIYAPDNYRFILFTDNIESFNSKRWEIRPIPKRLSKLSNNDINRYIKMHPYEFVETRYSLYVDGNVCLVTHVDEMIGMIDDKIGMAMYRHPFRNCMYTEALACIELGKGNKHEIRQQMNEYLKEGMPRNYGLIEATIFIVDNFSITSHVILEQWWNEYSKYGSGRDQLSLPFVLWKNGIKTKEIGTLGDDRRNDPRFQIKLYHT